MKKITLREFNTKTMKETTNDYIVASTKTQNILVDEKTKNGLYVAVLSAQEFYLDRDTANEIAKIASESLGVDISENVINALEIACIVKRLEK